MSLLVVMAEIYFLFIRIRWIVGLSEEVIGCFIVMVSATGKLRWRHETKMRIVVTSTSISWDSHPKKKRVDGVLYLYMYCTVLVLFRVSEHASDPASYLE
jgi:hypothetical protein